MNRIFEATIIFVNDKLRHCSGFRISNFRRDRNDLILESARCCCFSSSCVGYSSKIILINDQALSTEQHKSQFTCALRSIPNCLATLSEVIPTTNLLAKPVIQQPKASTWNQAISRLQKKIS